MFDYDENYQILVTLPALPIYIVLTFPSDRGEERSVSVCPGPETGVTEQSPD